jgi:manganese oxidase
MLSHKNILANFASCLILTGGVLLIAKPAAGQVPTQSAQRSSVTNTATAQAFLAADTGTAPIFSELDSKGATASSDKAEAGGSNAKGNASAKGVTASAKPAAAPQPPPPCARTINADVVALAQPYMLNRLGAAMPGGLIFALRRDTVTSGNTVRLKDNKRARPLVLRANVGDCIAITFTNYIPASYFFIPPPVPLPKPPPPTLYNTSEVSLHVQGMEWVTGAKDDGSFVGNNDSSLASVANPPFPPPTNAQTRVYTLYAREEGAFLLYTMGDTSSKGLQLTQGLFGALNVEPAGAEWYRSQVRATDLDLATYNANHLPSGVTLNAGCSPTTKCTLTINGGTPVAVRETPSGAIETLDNHPVVNYSATVDGTPNGIPILKMLDSGNNIVHADLTAIITGPKAGRFPGTTGVDNPEPPCNAEGNPALNPGGKVDPLFCGNPAAPDRKQPYREFTIIYHGALGPVATQAFPVLANSTPTVNNPMEQTTVAGQDAFAINYGTGGIAAEIYANRLGLGPMGDCADCKFEEFFLSAWSVGDPAMLVDRPANAMLQPPPPPSPGAPPIPPPPPLCTTTQLEGVAPPPAPGQTPIPQCANTRVPAFTQPYTLAGLAKATRAYYPDDPSNVYHSYINDHLKFRILHGGLDVSHVHHQHAHQWLQSPNSDEGSYLDSQMISPGASYTLEMVYNGSGNRNKVVGDSIFHCHFYPHFAAGMWAMWRTHDAFEPGTYVYPEGTTLNGKDVSGQVVPGSRALPDGEIAGGSPNPALVPMPTLPMAPLPAYAQIQNGVQVDGVPIPYGSQVVIGGTCDSNGKINGLTVIGGCTPGQQLNGTVISSHFDGTNMTGEFQPSPGNKIENPGYPYFIPGVAGARAPHPPLDFAPNSAGGNWDGGLPRHILTGGSITNEAHTATNWSKDLATAIASQLPEDGTAVEKAAMAFFGQRCYPTFFPDGKPGSCPSSLSTPPQTTLNTPPTGFILNGLPRGPQHGAPFADPAIDDNGKAVGTLRTYKAAAIQLDVTFNKKGWHYPQQRILTLWQDVAPTFAYKPGGSTGRQPEPLFFRGNSGDILEYWHTNLVPNYYEQDAFQVRTPTDILGQHIHLVKFDVTSSDGAGNGFNYEDGTFSPEEVQEIHHALVSTGGSWTHCAGCPTDLQNPQPPPTEICPKNGTQLPPQCTNGAWDGTQTTIQRWYLDPQVDNSNVDRTLRTVFTHDHFGPSTHQQAGLYAGLLVEPQNSTWTSNDGTVTFGSRSDGGPTSWQARIINGKDSYREFMLEFQDLQLAYMPVSAGSACNFVGGNGLNQAGKPFIPPSSFAINPPCTPSLITTGIPAVPAGTQSLNYTNEPIGYRIGQFGDISNVFDNATAKAADPLNNPDPMTPLMRAYQNDNVQVRVLVGAHVFSHQFDLEGPTWFSEPSWKNSGYRSAQAMGLSEHFEMLFHVPSSSAPSANRKCPDGMSQANCVDYLYSPSMDIAGLTNGLWGLFRSYDPTQNATGIAPLPNNPIGAGTNVSYATCPAGAPVRNFNITAVTSQQALASQNPGSGALVFNSHAIAANILDNPLGVIYFRSEDLNQGKVKSGVPIEPLILRANAGDCINVNLTNGLAKSSSVLQFPFQWPPPFTSIPVNKHMSSYVGLHPQLLSYDMATSSGANIGWNSQGGTNQITGIGAPVIKYQWYAGKVDRADNGQLTYTPVEFGALNMFPSDPLFQAFNGLFGQMIIEPKGSTWQCGEVGLPGAKPVDCDPSGSPPPTTRASATVTLPNNAGHFREFSLMISDNIRVVAGATNNGATSGAVNYGTEPFRFRYTGNLTEDFSCMQSNVLIPREPATPIFRADIGDTARFRMTHPYGTGTSQVFSLHGHVWQRNPYAQDSTVIGDNPLSQWLGSRDNHGSTDHFDMVIDKAGGASGQAGDYLYTVFVPVQAATGAWGIFRVGPEPTGAPTATNGACTPIVQKGYVPPPVDPDVRRFLRPPTPTTPSPK